VPSADTRARRSPSSAPMSENAAATAAIARTRRTASAIGPLSRRIGSGSTVYPQNSGASVDQPCDTGRICGPLPRHLIELDEVARNSPQAARSTGERRPRNRRLEDGIDGHLDFEGQRSVELEQRARPRRCRVAKKPPNPKTNDGGHGDGSGARPIEGLLVGRNRAEPDGVLTVRCHAPHSIGACLRPTAVRTRDRRAAGILQHHALDHQSVPHTVLRRPAAIYHDRDVRRVAAATMPRTNRKAPSTRRDDGIIGLDATRKEEERRCRSACASRPGGRRTRRPAPRGVRPRGARTVPREGPVRSRSSTDNLADRGGGQSSDDDFSVTRPNPRDPEPLPEDPWIAHGIADARAATFLRPIPGPVTRRATCVRRNETGPRVWRGPAWVFVPWMSARFRRPRQRPRARSWLMSSSVVVITRLAAE